MDEEMGEAVEIDIDYEYDAPKYFDLSGEEPVMEAIEAERWFETAESCPPSPLMMRIILEQNTSLQEELQNNPTTSEQNNNIQVGFAENGDNKIKNKTKGPFCKKSTLMNPTASHLAKQNKKTETRTIHRNNRLNLVKNSRISQDSKDCNIQAAKRQRLERGHLNKGTGAAQPDLIHKTRNDNVGSSRLKKTIPKEPNLQTMRRAEIFKARRGLPIGNQAPQYNNNNNTQTFTKIKPVSNKKEFNLTNTSRVEQIKSENKMQEESKDNLFKFKSGPSDKKVVPSNTKLNTTVPKEFNLSTSRRCQHPPPLTEVFNKLSIINTDPNHASTSKNDPSLPKFAVCKESKENIRINNPRC